MLLLLLVGASGGVAVAVERKGSTELIRPGRQLFVPEERLYQEHRERYSQSERVDIPNRRLF